MVDGDTFEKAFRVAILNLGKRLYTAARCTGSMIR